MDLEFSGEIFYWRGPAPHHFVAVPEPECAVLAAAAPAVSYGWGMIPVAVRIEDVRWTTSLWPKDGGYLVPLKLKVRTDLELDVGERVTLTLTVDG